MSFEVFRNVGKCSLLLNGRREKKIRTKTRTEFIFNIISPPKQLKTFLFASVSFPFDPIKKVRHFRVGHLLLLRAETKRMCSGCDEETHSRPCSTFFFIIIQTYWDKLVLVIVVNNT